MHTSSNHRYNYQFRRTHTGFVPPLWALITRDPVLSYRFSYIHHHSWDSYSVLGCKFLLCQQGCLFGCWWFWRIFFYLHFESICRCLWLFHFFICHSLFFLSRQHILLRWTLQYFCFSCASLHFTVLSASGNMLIWTTLSVPLCHSEVGLSGTGTELY